jgi:uncharacterized membrane protein YfcA
MFALYLMIGALAGTMAGLLGVGGGMVVIPALMAVFIHFDIIPTIYVMHMAVGTSLAAMIVTATSALHAYNKRGSVRWDLVRQLLPGLLVGAMIGAFLAQDMSSYYLQISFSAFLLFVAFRLFFAKYNDTSARLPSRLTATCVASTIGVLSSILGTGSGTMLIPFMLRYQVNLQVAAGTTMACGIGIGIVAAVSFMLLGMSVVELSWSTGYIYWPAFLGITLTSMLFAPMGAALAHKLSATLLKRVLAVSLVLIAIDMLYSI